MRHPAVCTVGMATLVRTQHLPPPTKHVVTLGPRPPGRLRPNRAAHLSRWTKTWAKPIYRHVYDPDGRPAVLKRNNAF